MLQWIGVTCADVVRRQWIIDPLLGGSSLINLWFRYICCGAFRGSVIIVHSRIGRAQSNSF